MTSALRALAARIGIVDAYLDLGGDLRHTTDDTRVALLAAMGIDASDEARAARTLERLDRDEAERMLEPVRVCRTDRPGPLTVPVRTPPGTGAAPIDYRLELVEEAGARHTRSGTLEPSASGTRRLQLPAGPAPGYHRVRLTLDLPSGDRSAETTLIVTPGRCLDPESVIGPGARVWGMWVNLYTVRSARNWGIGDLSDLEELVRWAGGEGGAFVGVNPLHALRNREGAISPYGPVSRLFHNVLYLAVARVPELRDSAEARAMLESSRLQARLRELRDRDRVDYEAVLDAKLPVLRALHRAFASRHRDRDTERGRAYAGFRARRGRALENHATFMALEAHLGRPGPRAEAWPPEYRRPDAPGVLEFRRANPEEVDVHRYLQFELDRQLGEVAAAADDAGLPIGVYLDLAVGSAADGSDVWAYPDTFVTDAHVGAPPDDYSATGQDWGLPPLDPRALRADRYRYWRLLLNHALEHAGALRIDHVMSLHRTFWVPAGRTAVDGAYVRYPGSDLLGILALESHRHGAVIIGEDLGTVPRGFSTRLAHRRILSSRVMYFERTRRGGFLASPRYSNRALVTATTHDHPPLAGFWEGRDLELRHEAGGLPTDDALEAARQARQRDREALLTRLRREGVWSGGAPEGWSEELCAAVHAYLSRTPAPLLGIGLDDLDGIRDPVNLPGLGLDRYPSWSRKMTRPLESLADDPGVAAILTAVSDRRTRGPSNDARGR